MKNAFRILKHSRAVTDKLRENTGQYYIEVIVTVLAITMLLIISISTFAVLMVDQRIDTASDEIARMVEVDGKYDTAEQTKAENLIGGIPDATVTCSASGEIRIGSQFTITVKGSGKLGVNGVGFVSIPHSCNSSGISGVYWKTT